MNTTRKKRTATTATTAENTAYWDKVREFLISRVNLPALGYPLGKDLTELNAECEAQLGKTLVELKKECMEIAAGLTMLDLSSLIRNKSTNPNSRIQAIKLLLESDSSFDKTPDAEERPKVTLSVNVAKNNSDEQE